MKTQNNNQTTVFTQVSKMVLYSSVIIFSVVFLSMTASAQKFWKQFSEKSVYGKTASEIVDPTSVNETTDLLYESPSTEFSIQVNNSKEAFVNETNKDEAIQATPVTTNVSFINSYVEIVEGTLEYNPEKFVEAELVIEQENLMNGNTDAVAIEEALEYNPEKFVEAELAIEHENLMNGNTETMIETLEAESAQQIEILMNEIAYNADKYVEVEINTEIKNWTTSDFIESTEAFTANEAEPEVAKYAKKVISNIKTKNALDKVDGMTDAYFFKSAERLTADGAEDEVTKYAKKVISETETDHVMTSWMSNVTNSGASEF